MSQPATVSNTDPPLPFLPLSLSLSRSRSRSRSHLTVPESQPHWPESDLHRLSQPAVVSSTNITPTPLPCCSQPSTFTTASVSRIWSLPLDMSKRRRSVPDTAFDALAGHVGSLTTDDRSLTSGLSSVQSSPTWTPCTPLSPFIPYSDILHPTSTMLDREPPALSLGKARAQTVASNAGRLVILSNSRRERCPLFDCLPHCFKAADPTTNVYVVNPDASAAEVHNGLDQFLSDNPPQPQVAHVIVGGDYQPVFSMLSDWAQQDSDVCDPSEMGAAPSAAEIVRHIIQPASFVPASDFNVDDELPPDYSDIPPAYSFSSLSISANSAPVEPSDFVQGVPCLDAA